LERKSINLALQGGGAHGAFTWGVVDRLLDETRLDIAAVSGTSAGALNGAALKSGWVKNGREGARAELDGLWRQVTGGLAQGLGDWMRPLAPAAISKSLEYSWPYMAAEAWTRVFSPYSWGPLYRNPLETSVQGFDFECVCADDGPDLFICATRVRNGKIRVFHGDEIQSDTILASACLPTLFKAVEIEDAETGRVEAFWDGGYTGNPALFPLFHKRLPDDIVIVNINPLERDALPVTPQQIQNRINEISFNSSLLRELRAIEFVQRLLEEGTMAQGDKAQVLVHMIADDALMNNLSVATKIVPNAALMSQLKAAGRNAAEQFLQAHWRDLNTRSSVDLRAMFG